MKEKYLNPELNLISFVPMETIADIPSFDFDNIQDGIFDEGERNEGSQIDLND